MSFRKEIALINSLLKEVDSMISAASAFLDGKLDSHVSKDLKNKAFSRLLSKPYFSAVDFSFSEGEKFFKGAMVLKANLLTLKASLKAKEKIK